MKLKTLVLAVCVLAALLISREDLAQAQTRPGTPDLFPPLRLALKMVKGRVQVAIASERRSRT